MTTEPLITRTAPPAAAQSQTEDPFVRVIDAIDVSLQSMAEDIGRSQQLLARSFSQIAAHFAQVHSIAVADESRNHEAPGETLRALRRVVDALTVELQFEDSLNQLLMHSLSRIDSIGAALHETRAMVHGPLSSWEEQARNRHAFSVLARTLDSLRKADQLSIKREFDGVVGSVDLF